MSQVPGLEKQLEDTHLRGTVEKKKECKKFIAPSFDSFRFLPDSSYLLTFNGKWISHFFDKTEEGCLPHCTLSKIWMIIECSIVCLKLQLYAR
ncbi:hypothetical protein CEXT_551611 [Caerostris extrusa]|uniref:Uncharacterized protein n=1 Tax=Caerostris extrusa TaxID=172846 RepID=A0AAV4SW30_CAEEX|nr:hypothetical protein CEXT_551611 [Caerostris extrusa]